MESQASFFHDQQLSHPRLGAPHPTPFLGRQKRWAQLVDKDTDVWAAHDSQIMPWDSSRSCISQCVGATAQQKLNQVASTRSTPTTVLPTSTALLPRPAQEVGLRGDSFGANVDPYKVHLPSPVSAWGEGPKSPNKDSSWAWPHPVPTKASRPPRTTF